MKKLLFVLFVLFLAILIVILCSRHSGLTGMWTGTHQIDSSTDGPTSFNSKQCKTFCKLTEGKGQLTGSITEFGMDAVAFQDTEELHGTISNNVVEWTSSKSWEKAGKKVQYESIFHGVRNGDTISGRFVQTWDEDGKTTTYEGTVELKRTPEKQ